MTPNVMLLAAVALGFFIMGFLVACVQATIAAEANAGKNFDKKWGQSLAKMKEAEGRYAELFKQMVEEQQRATRAAIRYDEMSAEVKAKLVEWARSTPSH